MRTAMVWCVVVVVGCGGGGSPDFSATEDTVCTEMAALVCYNMYRCCSEGEIEDFLMVDEPRSEEECRDDVRTVCERQLAVFDFSVRNNHVRFDAEIMNTCLDALVAPDDTCATISSMEPWAEACMQNPWVGVVEPGGQCDFEYECVKDSVCSPGRTCIALPGDGVPCGQGCASGLFCNAGICRPLLAQGATCVSTGECQKGLFCDAEAATQTCTPLRALGESCQGSSTCASTLCLPGTCAGTGGGCFGDGNCSAFCADDNTFCVTDGNCGAGTCNGPTPISCLAPADCTAVGGTCVFPVRCLPPDCVGDPVCAEPRVLLDYCEAALENLPIGPRGAAGALGPS